jgi:hypothetical protein
MKVISDRLTASKFVWLHLGNYLRRLVSKQELSATHLLEISVFDSGIGLAQQNLRHVVDDAISVEKEYASVLECLRKRGTSSTTPLRGLGLYRVMHLLTRLKGFLRLRTSRLGLFRDFLDDPYPLGDSFAPEKLQKDFYRGFEYLWDWDSDPESIRNDPNALLTKTRRALVTGTLFTLWIPLRTHGVQLSLLD